MNDIQDFRIDIKSLLLRGTTLKNTPYVKGYAIYCGHQTKMFKNTRKPKPKTSNVLKKMNSILYSVFIFLGGLCLIMASISCLWDSKNLDKHYYLGDKDSVI